MKEVLVKSVRKFLPKKTVHSLEANYRKARVHAVSARYGYPGRGLRVIAVTGTNGKTTTICYLNEILKSAGYKTALFSTAVIEMTGESRLNDLNATVALTSEMQQFLKEAKQNEVDYVLIEATSHALDQHKLDTIPIECAIMTNLTQDHLDYHNTMDNYAAAKAKLFQMNPRYIVLNRDDEWFEYFNTFDASEHKITYGTHEESEAQITGVKLYKKGSEAHIVVDHQTPLHVGSFLPGKYNVYNYCAAASAAYVMGVSLDAIVDGIATLESIPGRFERVPTEKSYEVIVDYAHTPDALEQLLATVKNMTKHRVILVFGACGDRDKEKRPIMGEVAARLADRVIVTDEESYGEEPGGIRAAVLEGIKKAGGEAKTEEIDDREEAIKKALSIARKDDIVLITGMGHEQYRIIKGERIPWNDAEIVKKILT
jgi:UDP-N-acetylmuramyl-tripeptide synthetase